MDVLAWRIDPAKIARISLQRGLQRRRFRQGTFIRYDYSLFFQRPREMPATHYMPFYFKYVGAFSIRKQYHFFKTYVHI